MDMRPPAAHKRLSATGRDKDSVWIFVPQATEGERIGDEIDAALIFAGTDFVNVLCVSHRNGQHLLLWLAHYFVVKPRKYCTANQRIEEGVNQSYYAADWRNRITKIHLADECGFSGRATKCDEPPREEK